MDWVELVKTCVEKDLETQDQSYHLVSLLDATQQGKVCDWIETSKRWIRVSQSVEKGISDRDAVTKRTRS